ncbi:hypothetical protein VTO73DRAFT_6468 [Trametes versicolor]
MVLPCSFPTGPSLAQTVLFGILSTGSNRPCLAPAQPQTSASHFSASCFAVVKRRPLKRTHNAISCLADLTSHLQQHHHVHTHNLSPPALQRRSAPPPQT